MSTTTTGGKTIVTLSLAAGANTEAGNPSLGIPYSLSDGKWSLLIDRTKVADRYTGERMVSDYDSVAAGRPVSRLFGDEAGPIRELLSTLEGP